MVDIRQSILCKLKDSNNDDVVLNSFELSKFLTVDHQDVVGVIKSLSSSNVIESKERRESIKNLTEEGECVVKSGSSEAILFNSISDTGTSIFNPIITNNSIGLSKAIQKGWIKIIDKEYGDKNRERNSR